MTRCTPQSKQANEQQQQKKNNLEMDVLARSNLEI